MRRNVCRMGIINFFSNIRWKIFFCSPNGYFKFMYITQNTYATLALSPLFFSDLRIGFLIWCALIIMLTLYISGPRVQHSTEFARNELRDWRRRMFWAKWRAPFVLVWIKRQESVSIKNSHQWHIVLGDFIALTSVDLYIVWLKQERIEHNIVSRNWYMRDRNYLNDIKLHWKGDNLKIIELFKYRQYIYKRIFDIFNTNSIGTIIPHPLDGTIPIKVPLITLYAYPNTIAGTENHLPRLLNRHQ